MSQTFITPKGTILYLIDVQGKPYLPVQERIIWFREENPKGRIMTEMLTHTDSSASAKATIFDCGGLALATGHKQENKQGFADFFEKAETGAIGRALAYCGYGTQFTALEMDEGKSRIVDAPSIRPVQAMSAWDYVIKCGKTYVGRPLHSLSNKDIIEFLDWIDKSAPKTFKDSDHVKEFQFFAEQALAIPRP